MAAAGRPGRNVHKRDDEKVSAAVAQLVRESAIVVNLAEVLRIAEDMGKACCSTNESGRAGVVVIRP